MAGAGPRPRDEREANDGVSLDGGLVAHRDGALGDLTSEEGTAEGAPEGLGESVGAVACRPVIIGQACAATPPVDFQNRGVRGVPGESAVRIGPDG